MTTLLEQVRANWQERCKAAGKELVVVTEPGCPPVLTTDETWGSADGFLELQQRNGIVAVHPGGTADIQRVSMARRIGIGRAGREATGTVL